MQIYLNVYLTIRTNGNILVYLRICLFSYLYRYAEKHLLKCIKFITINIDIQINKQVFIQIYTTTSRQIAKIRRKLHVFIYKIIYLQIYKFMSFYILIYLY